MGIIDAMDGAGVARALNAQVPWYGEDNRYHHESAARFPGPFALLGVIDPASAGAPGAVLERAGALGLAVQCLARMRDMGAIRRAAETFPAPPLVVDHLGH